MNVIEVYFTYRSCVWQCGCVGKTMFATAAAAWHPLVPTARRCIRPSAGVNRSARSRIWSKTGRAVRPWKTLWPRWMHRTATAPCTSRRKMGTCHWQSISWSRKQIQVLRTSMVRRRFIWVWPCWLLGRCFSVVFRCSTLKFGRSHMIHDDSWSSYTFNPKHISKLDD